MPRRKKKEEVVEEVKTEEVAEETKEEKPKKTRTSKKSSTKKKEEKKETKKTSKKKAKDEKIELQVPVNVYRGLGFEYAEKPFVGTFTVTGDAVDGFLPVKFVRPGIGECEGFLFAEEVEKWKTSK